MYHLILRRLKTVLDKSCRENQNTLFVLAINQLNAQNLLL